MQFLQKTATFQSGTESMMDFPLSKQPPSLQEKNPATSPHTTRRVGLAEAHWATEGRMGWSSDIQAACREGESVRTGRKEGEEERKDLMGREGSTRCPRTDDLELSPIGQRLDKLAESRQARRPEFSGVRHLGHIP